MSQSPQSLFVAAALAVLAIAAGFYGIRSPLALAAPGSASPPRATTAQPEQLRLAIADADFGPGQCEPCVVGLQ